MGWGLILSWWNNYKPLKEMRLATFNARSDSVAGKPTFSESFARRRCLIRASGYYEWYSHLVRRRLEEDFSVGHAAEFVLPKQLIAQLALELFDYRVQRQIWRRRDRDRAKRRRATPFEGPPRDFKAEHPVTLEL
jgi:hypothetical protein